MSKPVVMIFSAPWCAGCRTITPHLEALKEFAEVEYVNIDESPEKAAEHGVRALPTILNVTTGHRAYGAVQNLDELKTKAGV